MNPFKAMFDVTPHRADEGFRVDVIGYRQRARMREDRPKGVSCWFVFLFYESVPFRTEAGRGMLPPNSMMVCDPGSPVVHGTRKRFWQRSWIRFGGTEAMATLAESGLPLGSAIPFDTHEENERGLLAIYRELNHPRGANLRSVHDLFRIWLRSARRGSRLAPLDRVPRAFVEARRYIQEHWREPFTLADIAEQCHVSASHLCKGFQQHFDVSPISFAINVKMEQAKELLVGTDLNVTEIAEACGFSDLFYFSRLFKKRVGMSPRAYRASCA